MSSGTATCFTCGGEYEPEFDVGSLGCVFHPGKVTDWMSHYECCGYSANRSDRAHCDKSIAAGCVPVDHHASKKELDKIISNRVAFIKADDADPEWISKRLPILVESGYAIRVDREYSERHRTIELDFYDGSSVSFDTSECQRAMLDEHRKKTADAAERYRRICAVRPGNDDNYVDEGRQQDVLFNPWANQRKGGAQRSATASATRENSSMMASERSVASLRFDAKAAAAAAGGGGDDDDGEGEGGLYAEQAAKERVLAERKRYSEGIDSALRYLTRQSREGGGGGGGGSHAGTAAKRFKALEGLLAVTSSDTDPLSDHDLGRSEVDSRQYYCVRDVLDGEDADDARRSERDHEVLREMHNLSSQANLAARLAGDDTAAPAGGGGGEGDAEVPSIFVDYYIVRRIGRRPTESADFFGRYRRGHACT